MRLEMLWGWGSKLFESDVPEGGGQQPPGIPEEVEDVIWVP